MLHQTFRCQFILNKNFTGKSRFLAAENLKVVVENDVNVSACILLFKLSVLFSKK